MTNEEAIKNIVAYAYYADDIPEEVGKALDMAIEALKERDDLLERAYGHVVGQGTKGVIRDVEVTDNDN